MLKRKGILQAQASNVAGPASVTVKAVIAVDSNRPTGTPNWGQLPRKPLRFWLFYFIDINTEPPHSPPTPIPWHRRRTSRMTAAQSPMLE